MNQFFFIGVLLSLCSCMHHQPEMPLEEKSCVEIGLDEQTSFCWAYTYNHTENYYFNEVYLLKEGRRVEVVGMGDGSEINYMLVSPSKMYAAMEEDGGEGHPYLAIMTLEDIRQGKEPRFTAGYDPYPGGLMEMRWQGDMLIFSTDKDLASETGETSTYEVFYLLDAETGEMEQFGKPVPLP